MNDETKPIELRLTAARVAAPYLHSRPQPEPRFTSFLLPEKFDTPEALAEVHSNIVRAVAAGDMSLEEGKEVSVIIDGHRRVIETVSLEARIAALETKVNI